MALDFPLNPTTGTIYVSPISTVYLFDGVKWLVQTGSSGVAGPAGDIGPTGPAGPTGPIGIGLVGQGEFRQMPFYATSGTILTSTNTLFYQPESNTFYFGSYENNSAGAISVPFENTTTSFPPSKILFATNSGTSTPVFNTEIDSQGTLKTDKISSFTAGANVLVKTNIAPADDLVQNLGTENNRWNESFINALNVSSFIKFPDDTIQFSAYNTASNFMPTRTNLAITTPDLADNELIDVTFGGFPGYAIYKIQVSTATWVRIYINDVFRDNDSARLESDPVPTNAGIIKEFITTQTETLILSPVLHGFVDPPSNNIEALIKNKSGTTSSVTVSLTVIPTEML